MRLMSEPRLAAILSRLPGVPRVVASGNFATPTVALGVLDKVVAEYRLFMLNAQREIPDRAEVILETPFVGPGMRARPNLRYFPSRLSLVPHLLKGPLPPTSSYCTRPRRTTEPSRSGRRRTSCRRRSKRSAAVVVWSSPNSTRTCPTRTATAC